MCFKKFQNSRKMSRIKEVFSITYSRRNCNITVRNQNVEEPFCVPESFVYQKILCLRVELVDSLQKKNFVSQCRRLVGEPYCVPKNLWYGKKFWMREGGCKGGCIKKVCQKFSSDSAEIFR